MTTERLDNIPTLTAFVINRIDISLHCKDKLTVEVQTLTNHDVDFSCRRTGAFDSVQWVYLVTDTHKIYNERGLSTHEVQFVHQ